MSATLVQLLNVHSQRTDACLAYLDGVVSNLCEQPLLKRFGRSLDENGLRIPLHVEPFAVAKFRDIEAQRARERDNVSMQAGDVDAEKRIYAHRRGMEDESERRDRPKPEPLDNLLDTLEVAMILGDPGGGKSEALKRLAVRTARRVRGQLDQYLALPDEVCLPVFADLPTVARLFGDRGEIKALREFARDWLELGAEGERTFRRNGRTSPRAMPELDGPHRLTVSILKGAVKHLGFDFNDQRARKTYSPAVRKIWRDWTQPRPPDAKPRSGAPLLLDAWDEVTDKFRTDEFKAELLALSRQTPVQLFATSRIVGFESGVLDTPASAPTIATRRELVILPFRYDTTMQFIRAFFPAQATAECLIADLRSKPMVMSVLQNPLLATLVCLAFDPTIPDSLPVPARRGAVYDCVVRRLLGDAEAMRKGRTKLPGNVVAELATVLQHIAFSIFPDESLTTEALTNLCNEFAIPREWELRRFLDPRKGKSLFACLVESGLFTAHGENEFRFLHLTFQEYFAAGRLAAEIRKTGWDGAVLPFSCGGARGKMLVKVRILVENLSWHPRWYEVIALTASQIDPKSARVEPLLETIMACKDTVHHHRLCLAIRCLAEAQSYDQSTKGIAARLGQKAWELIATDDESVISDQRLGQNLGVADPLLDGKIRVLDKVAAVLGDPMDSAEELKWNSHFRDIIESASAKEILVELAVALADSTVGDDVRSRVASVVDHLGAVAGTPEILAALATILTNFATSDELLVSAAAAVRGIGAPAGTPEFLATLISILGNAMAADNMRHCAQVALRGIGTAAGTPQTLISLAAILGNPEASDGMRRSAANALRGLGPAAGTPAILNALTAILRSPDASDETRMSAACAVRDIGETAGTPEILAAIAAILGDPTASEDVRRQAANAVDYIGSAAGTPEILAALANILDDPMASKDMRKSAECAVRSIGAAAGTPEFLAAMVSILSKADDVRLPRHRYLHAGAESLGNPGRSDFMRESAAGALRSIGAAAGTPHVLAALTAILSNPAATDGMRRCAAEAFSGIGATAGTPETIASLVAILGNPAAPDFMRKCAATAAGGIGPAAGTPEILASLAAIIGDSTAWEYTRASAAYAVRSIGTAAGTPEVLAAIVGLFKHWSPWGCTCTSALGAAGGIGAAAATPEILSAMIMLLGSSSVSEHVRGSAVETVRDIGEGARTPEMLAALAAFLADSKVSDYYRVSAIRAVESTRWVAGTPAIIAALAAIIGDSTVGEDVRKRAAEAVSGLGVVAGTPEIIAALASLLIDSSVSDHARECAVRAVSSVGAAAGTAEFFAALETCPTSKAIRSVLRHFDDWRWFKRVGFFPKHARRINFAKFCHILRIGWRWFQPGGNRLVRITVAELAKIPSSPRQ